MLRPFPKQPLDGAVAPPCACFRLQSLSWAAVVTQAPDSALAAGGAQSPTPARLPVLPEHNCRASFSCKEGSLGHWYWVAVSPQFPQQLLRCPRVLKSCFLCCLYLQPGDQSLRGRNDRLVCSWERKPVKQGMQEEEERKEKEGKEEEEEERLETS